MTELSNLESVLQSGIMSGYAATPEGENGGIWCRTVERQLCEYLQVSHAVLMSSATVGLYACVNILEKRGSYVATTPVTFAATWAAIRHNRLVPLPVDIEPYTYNMDVRKLTGRASIVMPVHLMGYPCDMEDLMNVTRRNKQAVIEDCAQAFGAEFNGQKVGTFGEAGVFSFNQKKLIHCGEGGAVVTNDSALAKELRQFRNHGEVIGGERTSWNYRMTELQAAVLSAKLEQADTYIRQTRDLCQWFGEKVRPYAFPDTRRKHVYCYYPVRVYGQDRDSVQARLLVRGVYFGMGGYKPVYRIPAYKQWASDCPQADLMEKQVMFTNIFRPPMTKERVLEIAGMVNEELKPLKLS